MSEKQSESEEKNQRSKRRSRSVSHADFLVIHVHGFSNSSLVDELSKLVKILLLAEEMNNTNVYRNEAYEHGRKRRKYCICRGYLQGNNRTKKGEIHI